MHSKKNRPSGKSAITRLLLGIQMLLACAVMSACASLPDVRDLAGTLEPAAAPTVATANGNLSASKAESLLSKRLRNAKKTDLLALAALEEAATGSPLIAGNKTTLLFDGPATITAMMAAIEGATDHINFETYIFDEDELGIKFADLLIAKQRAGVQVNIIYDSIGTVGVSREFFQRLRDAGVNLTEFNPVNPLKRFGKWRINNRDHRKILIVDGRIGFAGGVNIAEDYSNSSLFRSRKGPRGELGWRDTHLQLEGPAVASLQWLFMGTWAIQNDKPLPDLAYFPPLPVAGDKVVRIVASAPGGDFEIYKAFTLALQEAKLSIHMTNAYFAPDAQILETLLAAARRSVDVKIIFPSQSDAGLVYHAGRSFYTELLKAGVRIFELKGSVLHAKTTVVDGIWSTVGSSNFDIRSFLHNSEINVIVLGDPFGRTMESAFQEDVRNSNEITLEKWEQRPQADRIKEWAARRLVYYL
ncbi:MAG: cardiolipin synthase [Noviherbaspirillum sp.]